MAETEIKLINGRAVCDTTARAAASKNAEDIEVLKQNQGLGGNADSLTMTSPDGSLWKLTVSNDGVVTAVKQTDGGEDGGETITFNLPRVYLDGDLTGISDDNYVNVTCRYVNTDSTEWTDYAEIAWQGSSSMNFTNVEDGVDKAKNYKIKLYTDEARTEKNKRQFKDWHKTNNYHIKANYGDCTNFMNNMMMHFLTKSYQYLTPLPRDGAMYTVDGFPILLYINDVFCGIRFWNLKQDDKVYKLFEEEVDETTGEITQEADLCYQIGLNNGSSSGDNSGSFIYGNLNSGSNAGKNFADAHAEIDYYWEDRIWDKTGNHPDILYNTIQWVSEATDEEFKANLEQHFDKEYLIHYFVMMMACGMGDSICKNFNMLYFPDMGKWYATFWDMDFAFGTYWSLGTVNYNIDILTDSRIGHSRLWEKLWANFKPEVVAKYWELRKTVLTVEQVEDSTNAVWGMITSDQISENYEAKYNGKGNFKTNGASYVKTWATNRFAYMDTVMVVTEEVPTTAISLDVSELIFNNSSTQKITATVAPANSTDEVIWSSDDENIATVSDGYVKPVGLGNCVITAQSGDYTATCAVSVISVDNEETVLSIEAVQGNASSNTTALNRVTVFIKDVRVLPLTDLSVTAHDGYQVYAYNMSLGNVGVGSRGDYWKTTAIRDDGTIPRAIKSYVNTVWSANAVLVTNEEDNGITYAVVGFMMKREDNADFTPDEALTAFTITGYGENADLPDISFSYGYIDDNGNLADRENTYVNNRYDAIAGVAIIALPFSVADLRIAEYDEDKNFIARRYESGVSGGTYTLDDNTRYIRVGFGVGSDTNVAALFDGYTVSSS